MRISRPLFEWISNLENAHFLAWHVAAKGLGRGLGCSMLLTLVHLLGDSRSWGVGAYLPQLVS